MCTTKRPVENKTTETIVWSKLPIKILQTSPPPSTEHINSAYKLKAQPELTRYLHAAARFSTLPTWLAAIKNGHYKSWLDLTAAAAKRSFPKSNKIWRGHGRKIQMNLRSTKQALEEEEANYIALNLVPPNREPAQEE